MQIINELEKFIAAHEYPRDGNLNPEHQSMQVRVIDLRAWGKKMNWEANDKTVKLTCRIGELSLITREHQEDMKGKLAAIIEQLGFKPFVRPPEPEYDDQYVIQYFETLTKLWKVDCPDFEMEEAGVYTTVEEAWRMVLDLRDDFMAYNEGEDPGLDKVRVVPIGEGEHWKQAKYKVEFRELSEMLDNTARVSLEAMTVEKAETAIEKSVIHMNSDVRRGPFNQVSRANFKITPVKVES